MLEKAKRRIKIALAAICVALAAICVVLVVCFFVFPDIVGIGRSFLDMEVRMLIDHRFRRECFETVVQKVRDQGLKPGETRRSRLDDAAAPGSFRPWKASDARGRGQRDGTVLAKTTADGKLKVVIVTVGLGHLGGEHGSAYSETPLTITAYVEVNVPGQWFTSRDMKSDDNWWEVFNNLD